MKQHMKVTTSDGQVRTFPGHDWQTPEIQNLVHQGAPATIEFTTDEPGGAEKVYNRIRIDPPQQ